MATVEEKCPEGRTDFEACFAPFRYCPVKGCGRAELPKPRPEAADLSSWMQSPHKIAVDGKGYVWRAYEPEVLNGCWSMAPVNPDNSPIPQPVTYYVPEAELAALRGRIREIHAEAEKESECSEAAGEIAELLAALLPESQDPKKVNDGKDG